MSQSRLDTGKCDCSLFHRDEKTVSLKKLRSIQNVKEHMEKGTNNIDTNTAKEFGMNFILIKFCLFQL